MNTLNWFSRPILWLTLYLILLGGSAFIYINSLQHPEHLHLSGVNAGPVLADKVSISVEGSAQGNQQAYLSLDAANTRAIVGNIPVFGFCDDVAIADEKVYVLSRKGGVKVYALNNSTRPELIGTRRSSGMGIRSNVKDNFLFVSHVQNGTAAYSLQDNRIPSRIPGVSFMSLYREGQIFVASGEAGLSIFEFWGTEKSKEETRLLGRLNLPGFTLDLAFMGDALVAASASGGLHLIDIHDAESPRLIQTIAGGKKYLSLWVSGDIVYAADGKRQLDIFRFSGGRLTLSGSLPLFGRVMDFIQDEERLYMAELSYGISALDIRDPLRPRRIGFVGTPGQPEGLALYGDYLYVASNSQGVQIVDTRLIEPINVVASVNTADNAFAVELDGRWLYVADGAGGLQVVDRSAANDLKVVSSLPTDVKAQSLVKSGDTVFMALDKQGLIGVDVSDPLRPRLRSHFIPDVNISDLAVRGSELFASSYAGKLLRIDISDPERPTVVDSVALPGRPKRLALAGDDVFVAAEKAGLLVVRFSPGLPGRMISRLTRPWPMDDFLQAFAIAVRGDYAYLVQGEEGLQIVDISQPEKPKELVVIPLAGQGLSLQLSETYAVVATRWRGYYFIDISRPKKPYLAANIHMPRTAYGFKIEGGLLYSPVHSSGINVIPLPVKNTDRSRGSESLFSFEKPQFNGWYDLSVSNGKEFVRADSVLRID